MDLFLQNERSRHAISVRYSSMKNCVIYVTIVLFNAVCNPPLEIVHRSGQQLLIDREHFLADGILQLFKLRGL
jgi:hypothetical protein